MTTCASTAHVYDRLRVVAMEAREGRRWRPACGRATRGQSPYREKRRPSCISRCARAPICSGRATRKTRAASWRLASNTRRRTTAACGDRQESRRAASSSAFPAASCAAVHSGSVVDAKRAPRSRPSAMSAGAGGSGYGAVPMWPEPRGARPSLRSRRVEDVRRARSRCRSRRRATTSAVHRRCRAPATAARSARRHH